MNKEMKKVAFYTLGCKVNQYETNAMIEQFMKKGYEIVNFEEKADIYIINTCTVTNMADRKSRQILRRAKHKNKEVFIPLDERMEILRNIKFVDEVIVCADEDIDDYPKIKYDYLFVGSDYLGTERFNRYEQYFSDKNVRIIYLPYTTKTSSTQLRNLISAKSPSRN